MKYRRFGKTEYQMPLISVGGMRYQTSWERKDRIQPTSIKKLEKIVAHALDLGMYHFETAYGYGTSEEELGQVLPNYNRSDLLIQTKVGPKEDVNDFLRNFETSMKSLKVDYLDLFAIHGINNDEILDSCLKKGSTIDKALELKQQGVIRSLGFSTHGPLETILRTIRTGYFDYVNLWYSYIYPTNLPAIREAQKNDMGVFIISPNDKGGRLFEPSEKIKRLCAPLSPMMFHDVFILSDPDIHTISCGAVKPEDLDEHHQAVERMDEIQQMVPEIVSQLDTELDKVIDPQWIRTYTQGLPSWERTPGRINIPIILWLWNLVKAFDMLEYARFRYNLMGNAEHWFPGADPGGLTEIDRIELRKSLDSSPYADRIVDILFETNELLKKEKVQRLSNE
jgi:predicted aldo/keto reductase-like oxidoreductase